MIVQSMQVEALVPDDAPDHGELLGDNEVFRPLRDVPMKIQIFPGPELLIFVSGHRIPHGKSRGRRAQLTYNHHDLHDIAPEYVRTAAADALHIFFSALTTAAEIEAAQS